MAKSLIGSKPNKKSTLPTGVTYVPRIDKYMVKMWMLVDGVSIRKTLGYYTTEYEAGEVYRKAKQEYLDRMLPLRK